jgi:hypothetical protein
MIRGIGPVYARKLVRAFGEAVFDIIAQAGIATALAHAPTRRRIVFETRRMAPMLFHGRANSACQLSASRAGRPIRH